jgi:hypothetical protein
MRGERLRVVAVHAANHAANLRSPEIPPSCGAWLEVRQVTFPHTRPGQVLQARIRSACLERICEMHVVRLGIEQVGVGLRDE